MSKTVNLTRSVIRGRGLDKSELLSENYNFLEIRSYGDLGNQKSQEIGSLELPTNQDYRQTVPGSVGEFPPLEKWNQGLGLNFENPSKFNPL